MITDPLVAGGTAAVLLKGLMLLEQVIQKRRNGANGFVRDDHDTLKTVASGIDRLHEDLVELRRDIRDCLDRR